MERKEILSDWLAYLKPPLVGYEKGFIQCQGALPHQWELCERQSGQGWVYGLTCPQNFGEYLEMVTPEGDLKPIIEGLSASLVEAKARLSQRNRQIRDLRRQLRK